MASHPSTLSASVSRPAPINFARRLWRDRPLYLFLVPTLILYGLFTLYPIVASFVISLMDWNGFAREARFVGLDNYAEVIQDPLFWSAFRNTFSFMLISVPIRASFALFLALILNDKHLPFRSLFRTALFLPVVTTTAIVGIVMTFIFDPVGGPVNEILVGLGLADRPINFLGKSETALYTAMGIHVWKWFGVTLIYWLSALQTLPEEVYEAAYVDGANSWTAFRHVTIPLLIPFAAVILMITAIDTLRVFDLILTLTGGGPFLRTEVVEVYIFRWAFSSSSPRLGYASAAAAFFGLATLVMAVLQVGATSYVRRWRGESE